MKDIRISYYGRNFRSKENAEYYKELRDNPPQDLKINSPEMRAYIIGYQRPAEKAPGEFVGMKTKIFAAWAAGVDNATGGKKKRILNKKIQVGKRNRKTYREKLVNPAHQEIYDKLRANPPQDDLSKLRATDPIMNAYVIGYQLPHLKHFTHDIKKGSEFYAAWAAGVDNRKQEEIDEKRK